ncbi:MAG: protein translocase subunit SecDF [Flavobacteriales bacterium]
MQNRSALWVFTILLAIACLWQLSFSFFTKPLERKAAQEGSIMADSVLAVAGNERLTRDSIALVFENKYLREHAEDVVYPVFGYTYKECKEREINQGLDLKGGMAVTLEVSIPEMVANLSGNSQDPAFLQAMENAREAQRSRSDDFITLFDEEFRKVAPSASLAAIFSSQDNQALFPRESSNEQVVTILREQAQIALNNTEKILRTRIDKFGVAQPSIQKQALSGRIQIELPGVKDKERVRKLLQSTANLEFYETFDRNDVFPKLGEANTRLSALLHPDLARLDSARNDSIKQVQAELDSLKKGIQENTALDSLRKIALIDSLVAVDSTRRAENQMDSLTAQAEAEKRIPLFGAGRIEINQAQVRGQQHVDVLGYCRPTDTAKVNGLLRRVPVQSPDPSFGIKLAWSAKSERLTNGTESADYLTLRALKIPRDGKPRIDGSVITDARQDFDLKGDAEVAMQMNQEGAVIWKQMTGENVGKNVAIVLDEHVVSSPTVIGEIPGGRSSISMGSGDRNRQIEEAGDLANILKAGALPAPARIIDETVVGPTLGEANVQGGLISFAISLVCVLLIMVAYYARAGWVADIALLANAFILLGCMASLQATLTLPGIAGIVLTIGMAVDANVLINESVREQLKQGRVLKSAVDNAYKFQGALSAIVDSNITTFVTGVILFYFGSGPIKGFATTLMIGILSSLFTAIYVSRLIMSSRLDKNKPISFWMDWSRNIFDGANYDFMSKRKVFYVVSALVIGAGVASMFTRGFNLGVDFTGGRSYVVRFQEPVEVEQVRVHLEPLLFEEGRQYTVGVKTYGGDRQIKLTTNYLIDEPQRGTDQVVDDRVKEGLTKYGAFQILESRKVDATISDDIKTKAFTAVFLALVFMFGYIAVRFNNWRFGAGALLSLVHDTLFVLGLYSLLWGVVGFSLEIDEGFIAVILTVIGYSINDTVVVFDRIREYLREHRREPMVTVFNKAINSTLSRTLNTGVCTMLVLIIIFAFGGVSIKGFVFGLFAGILTGTYSSIFVASAAAVDLYKGIDQSVSSTKETAVA